MFRKKSDEEKTGKKSKIIQEEIQTNSDTTLRSSSPRFSNTIRPIQAPHKSGKKHPGRRLNILSKHLPVLQNILSKLFASSKKYPFKTFTRTAANHPQGTRKKHKLKPCKLDLTQ